MMKTNANKKRSKTSAVKTTQDKQTCTVLASAAADLERAAAEIDRLQALCAQLHLLLQQPVLDAPHRHLLRPYTTGYLRLTIIH